MKKLFTMMMVCVLLMLVLPVKAATDVNVLDPTALFLPDIMDVWFESDVLFPGEGNLMALPSVLPFNADLVNVEQVPNDGTNVYVAVLDTGLLPEWPFFLSQADIAVEYGIGFTHDIYWDDIIGDIVIGPLRDDRGFITDLASGHGTHVTSTIVGFNVNNLYWVDGVAPKVTIIPVLVLDAWEVVAPGGVAQLSGGTDEMVAAGIRYIADLAPELDAPVVINMSLGGPDRTTIIEEAIDYAVSMGVVVVASAGNEGEAGMGYPGGMEQVISAGAGGWADMFNFGWRADVPEKINKKDTLGNNWQIYLEDFSSRPNIDLDQKHQDLDVTAPGAWIVGPYSPAFSPSVGYYYVSGTSMAAPHVSAMAALLLQSYPEVKQFQIESILEVAAAGVPLPASDAMVAYPFAEPYYYLSSWDGGDYGSGFLLADNLLKAAGSKIK